MNYIVGIKKLINKNFVLEKKKEFLLLFLSIFLISGFLVIAQSFVPSSDITNLNEVSSDAEDSSAVLSDVDEQSESKKDPIFSIFTKKKSDSEITANTTAEASNTDQNVNEESTENGSSETQSSSNTGENTESPVSTATPTATPTPIVTPVSTAPPTATPIPTATPVPTATPTTTPTPTATPIPTSRVRIRAYYHAGNSDITVRNAQVKLVNLNTGEVFTGLTDADGYSPAWYFPANTPFEATLYKPDSWNGNYCGSTWLGDTGPYATWQNEHMRLWDPDSMTPCILL